MKNIVLVLCFTFSCFHFLFSQNIELSVFSIPDSLTNNANSVVRSNSKSIILESPRKMITSVKKTTTVLNKLGNHESNLVIHYDKNTKIKSLKAIFYDSFGKKIKEISKNKFDDYSATDGISLHNDGRVKSYEYIPISYPYTVHLEYQIESSNTAFISGWVPIDAYYQSIESSFFSISYPEDISLQKIERNFNHFNIKTNGNNGYEYSMSNQVALPYEEYSPDFLDIFPNVRFASNKFHLEGYDGYAENWNDFSKWMHKNLLAPRNDLPENTKVQIKNLVKGIEDPIDKARKVYEYVQQKTRYISIQVGIGGWMPMLVSEVDKLGYGDCKGLTYYTKALMDEVGVKSYYTAVHAGSKKKNIEKDLISVQGNHVFLYVPSEDKDYWLECTSQTVPFGYQSDFTDDRDVLVISDSEGKIMHTPVYDEKNSVQDTKAIYSLDAQGNLKAEVSIESSGLQYDYHFRINEKNKRDIDKYYKENYWSFLNNLTINNYNFHNDKKNISFKEELRIEASSYATISSERLLFPVNPFNRYTRTIKRYRNRKFPLEISRGFYDKDEYIINLPKGYTIEATPENVSIENKFGEYSLKIEKINNDQIKYSRSLLLLKGLHPKEDYETYRKFKKKIAKLDRSKIVLIKN